MYSLTRWRWVAVIDEMYVCHWLASSGRGELKNNRLSKSFIADNNYRPRYENCIEFVRLVAQWQVEEIIIILVCVRGCSFSNRDTIQFLSLVNTNNDIPMVVLAIASKSCTNVIPTFDQSVSRDGISRVFEQALVAGPQHLCFRMATLAHEGQTV